MRMVMGVGGSSPKGCLGSLQGASAAVALPPSPASAISCSKPGHKYPARSQACSSWQQMSKAKWCSALLVLCCWAAVPAGSGVSDGRMTYFGKLCSFETFFQFFMKNNVKFHIRQPYRMCMSYVSSWSGLEGHWHCSHSEMGTSTLKTVVLSSKAMEVYLHDSCILILWQTVS